MDCQQTFQGLAGTQPAIEITLCGTGRKALLSMMQYVGVIDILWDCQQTVRDEFYQK